MSIIYVGPRITPPEEAIHQARNELLKRIDDYVKGRTSTELRFTKEERTILNQIKFQNRSRKSDEGTFFRCFDRIFSKVSAKVKTE